MLIVAIIFATFVSTLAVGFFFTFLDEYFDWYQEGLQWLWGALAGGCICVLTIILGVEGILSWPVIAFAIPLATVFATAGLVGLGFLTYFGCVFASEKLRQLARGTRRLVEDTRFHRDLNR